MANQKTNFLSKDLADKIFRSFEYWEKSFSLKEVLPELRFIILTIAFYLINIALLTIGEMHFEDSLIASIVIILISLLLTRAFSNLCLIGTSIVILIFIIKFSFMSYSTDEFVFEYQGLVRSLNPLNYFIESDSTSERKDEMILTDLETSEGARKCAVIPSAKYLNNFLDEFQDRAKLISDNIFTKIDL